MFASLKAKLTGSVNKFSGQKDFLEAVCAACALVAFADGSCSDEEADATIKAVVTNPNLAAAFGNREIEQTADTMLKRASGGRVGRQALYNEIADIASDPDKSEAVLLSALDVADSGGIDDAEKAVLDKIAKSLGLNLASYL